LQIEEVIAQRGYKVKKLQHKEVKEQKGCKTKG
jgi:hypothetical protein